MNEKEIKEIKKESEKFKKILKGYKNDPNKYRTGNFYFTPSKSKVESIYECDYLICGVIVESELKSEIGLLIRING